jgi:predicted  nucleic acid-binding Zn-ribbon protein
VAIVQGLFSDILPPQMMHGGGGMRPVMQPAVQPPLAPAPVMATPVANQKGVAPEPAPLRGRVSAPSLDELRGIVPTSQKTIPPNLATMTQQESFVDPNQMDLSLLQDLDLSGVDLETLNNLTYQDVTQSLTGIAPAPTTPEGWANLYNNYSQSIAGGMSEGVDINDRPYFYNYQLGEAIQGFQGTPDEFRASVGLPETFSIYDDPQQGITTESAQTAYQTLSGASNPIEALSQYYGIELQAATPNENSVYNNADKYGTTPEQMAEFQSVITPVLQQVIPYIQMTQGLRFDDALEYAYKNDPMIAAIYNQYGVDLFRQTDDGSTYYYDPFSGLEARTVEVKDTSFRDVGLALTLAAAGAILGPVIGGPVTEALALEGATATAVNAAITNGLTTALQGGDFKDILTSAVTAGVTGPLNQYVGGALGVSDEIAAGIVEAGLQKAQGADTEEALLSGFIAAGSEWLRGQMPTDEADVAAFQERANIQTEGGGLVSPSGEVLIGDNAIVPSAFTPSQTSSDTLSEVVVTGTRLPAVDVTSTIPSTVAAVTQPTATTRTEPTGGMLTADTPAGDMEEIIVTGEYNPEYHGYAPSLGEGWVVNPLRGNEGEILRYVYVATNEQGEEVLVVSPDYKGDTFGLEEEDLANFLANYQLGNPAYSTAFGVETPFPENFNPFASQGREIDFTQTEGDVANKEVVDTTAPDKPVDPTEQPEGLKTDTSVDIPDIDIENLPPEATVQPVQPPVTPEPPVIPTPTGGGGGASGGGSAPSVTGGGTGTTAPPVVPTGGTEGTEGTTTQGGGEEVVDVFGDAGLEGDAFGDSTVGGSEGGAPVGGDAGTVDVTTTQEYQDLQNELDNALGNQSELEIKVDNLQNEVDAANAALAEAEAAAEAAEAAGAANAEELRGEVAAAQATADGLQSELNNANEALGNANGEIESLQGQLSEGQFTTTTEQNTALQEQLAEANANATDLESKLNTANTELNDLQTEYENAVETNADNVADLEGEITDKQGEINDLESELSGANSTIEDLRGAIADLESALAEAEAATAVAVGEADAAAAGETGNESGYGTGDGEGEGDGSGSGKGFGSGTGMFGLGGGRGTQPFTPQPFMASISYAPELLTPYMPPQSKDYLAELIARLQK